MEKTYNLSITLEGVTRDYKVTEEDIVNNSWNEEVWDLLDTVQESKEM